MMPEFRYSDRVLSFPDPRLHYDVPVREVISFEGGLAYPNALPDVVAVAREALTKYRSETLQYSPTNGLLGVREWVAEYVGGEGVSITAEHVLIVNGAKHGLDLVCKVFLNPGDSVVVTTPTYQTALPIFRGYEVDFLEVAQDSDGLIVSDLEERLRELARKKSRMPKLLYVPEFHNPTGITMSQRRRFELVDLAQRYRMLVVEDDPYRRIRFEGVPVPPIQSLDTSGCVIGLGTFSKIVAPGLRVGWVAATPEIIGKLVMFKSDGGSCPLTQRVVLEFCKADYITPHIQNLVRIYTEHRDVTLKALSQYLPSATAVRPQGGYYVWVRLPGHVNSDKLLPVALRHGVEFLPASVFYANSGPANYLRLAYSYPSSEAISDGMRRLGAAVAELTSREGLPMR